MTLLLLAGAWLLGVYLGVRFDLPLSVMALFFVAAFFFLILLRTLGRSFLPGLLLAALLLGVVRVEALGDVGAGTSLDAYLKHEDIRVKGLVVSDPEASGSVTRLRLRVNAVGEGDGEWQEAHEDVLATLRAPGELTKKRDRPYFRYGDLLMLTGAIDSPAPFEGFDYPAYLARQGITTVMSYPRVVLLEEGQGSPFYRWLYASRRALADSLAETVPEPQSSILQALLLGLRRDIPGQVMEDFNATGTTHLLAISGLNVAVLLGVALAVSQAVLGRRRRLYLLAPFLLVWIYTFISGASPSVVRAAIMASVYLFGRYLGRPGSVFPSLGVAAAVMVGLDPNVLWDISFQLSFAGIGGIALFEPPFREWLSGAFQRLKKEDWTSSIFTATSGAVATTLAATIATLPLIGFYFHRISLVGVPATLVTLPATPAIMSTGALAGLVGLVSPLLAQPLAWIAWAFTAYLTESVRLFSLIPIASMQVGGVGPLLVLTYYGVLLLLALGVRAKGVPGWLNPGTLLRSEGPFRRESVAWWVVAPLGALAALLWIGVFYVPDGKLRVTFLDVGQGDGILIEAPAGQQILIDGGPDSLEAVRALGKRMPFWDRSLDMVVLTHPHQDHINGLLEVLRRYKVQYVLERAVPYESSSYTAWQRLLQERGIPTIQANEGQVIALKGGIFIQVLGPPANLLEGTASDVDNNSVALRLVYGGVSFLFAGEIFSEAEQLILSRGYDLNSTVLKVAHHGSRTSSSAAFLKAVSPRAAAISVGADNPFDHPHRETIQSLRQYVAEERILVTKDRGFIQVISDGKGLKVVTER